VGLRAVRDGDGLYDLKLAARALIFVQQNNISNIAGMSAAMAKMKERNDELRGDTFSISRRLPVLTKHLKHADNYAKYRKVYEHWHGLKEGTPAEKNTTKITPTKSRRGQRLTSILLA
jgi:hypothetical protein